MRVARLLAAVLVAGMATAPVVRAASVEPAGACVGTVTYRAGAVVSRPAEATICAAGTGLPSAEPTLGVTRDGTVVLYPAFLPNPSLSYTRPAVAVSTDGGSTFRASQVTVAGTVPTHPVDFDPYLYVDPTTSRIFVESNTSGTCGVLSFSDDGAKTWSTHTVDGCVTSDHQHLFAGPAPPGGPAPSGYTNVVYRCSYSLGLFGTGHLADSCEKSLDGGIVWVPTGLPAFTYDPAQAVANPDVSTTPYGCVDQLGHGVVGADGTVYLPGGMCGIPQVAVSADEGATWTVRTVSTQVRSHQYPNGVTVNDTAVAVDGFGRMYALWISTDTLPYLATSSDKGATWSKPIKISPPGVVGSALPEIIANGKGQVAISFMGSTNAPPYPQYVPCPAHPDACIAAAMDSGKPSYADVTWSGYLLVSKDPGAARPHLTGGPVAAGPYVRGECGPEFCAAAKDFLDVRFGPDGVPYASYVSACSPTCATAAGGTDDMNVGVVARLVRR
jgi:hypothetical protein